MENFLILNEVGDLMFLEIVIDEMKKQLKQIMLFIASMKLNSPYLKQYEEEKSVLVELIKAKVLDENYLCLREKLVSNFNIIIIF
jgi:hypothetical protein